LREGETAQGSTDICTGIAVVKVAYRCDVSIGSVEIELLTQALRNASTHPWGEPIT
jgi:hypothetical protein